MSSKRKLPVKEKDKRVNRPCILLSDAEPEIFAELDASLNPNVNLRTLKVSNATTILWFTCLYHSSCREHIWKTSLYARLHGRDCTFCATRPRSYCKCTHPRGIALADTHPLLFHELDFDLNDHVDLFALPFYSSERVWWRCTQHTSCDRHFWKCSIRNRVYNQSGCPLCANSPTKFCGCNPEKTLSSRPDLVAELDGDYDATQIGITSHRLVNWKCSKHKTCKGHRWKTSVYTRTKNGSGCPFCATSARQFCECRAEYWLKNNPLSKELDEKKNTGEKIDTNVILGSTRRVWWNCPKGHSWITSVRNRAAVQSNGTTSGCPSCVNVHDSILCRTIKKTLTDWELSSLRKRRLRIANLQIRCAGISFYRNSVHVVRLSRRMGNNTTSV